MTSHLTIVEKMAETAILFMCPAPKRMLLSMGAEAKINELSAASFTRSYLSAAPKRTDDTSAEKMKKAKQGRRVAGILKMTAAKMWADKSSPRPLSSETNLGSEAASPKSDIIWMNELTRVNAVSIPICSWVIALARYVSPKTPIRFVNTFWTVRYIDPEATSEASIVFVVPI